LLKFHDDAIELSGETGTKLKSEIIGKYYPLWWEITSGGMYRKYPYTTTIIEMNAGTGEDYIADSNETILGSSGHALNLKSTNPNTEKLNVILVEEDPQCYTHLLNVIKRNWPNLTYSKNPFENNEEDVFLLRNRSEIFDIVEQLRLGNSLFFFDPLLYTPWSEINKVARKRITDYYQTRTEFIVFLFTSDWFSGRGDLTPLPQTSQKESWGSEEVETVAKAQDLFGYDKSWMDHLLNSKPNEDKIEKMVSIYRNLLHGWFRYVLPMPFEPKVNQIYHLFMCSNYEVGINITQKFYTKYTRNPPFSPNNKTAYSKFVGLHPEKKMRGSARSDEWKILWEIIRKHDEGICDNACMDLIDIQLDGIFLQESLDWLWTKKYLKEIEHFSHNWDNIPLLYQLDWDYVEETLGITRPLKLMPLSKYNLKDSVSQLQPHDKKGTLEEWF